MQSWVLGKDGDQQRRIDDIVPAVFNTSLGLLIVSANVNSMPLTLTPASIERSVYLLVYNHVSDDLQ